MINLLLSLNNFDENWCYSILKDIIKKDYNVLIYNICEFVKTN